MRGPATLGSVRGPHRAYRTRSSSHTGLWAWAALPLSGRGWDTTENPAQDPPPGVAGPRAMWGAGRQAPAQQLALLHSLQIVLVLSRKTTPGRREPPGSTEGQWLSLTVSGVSTPR